MTRFRIRYIHPETGEEAVHEGEWEATETVTAREWAEDFAYTLADKGSFTVTELRG